MNYEEFLKSPEISREFNAMFKKEVEHFRKVSKELGMNAPNSESFSIKMASVSTEMHFGRLFHLAENKGN